MGYSVYIVVPPEKKAILDKMMKFFDELPDEEWPKFFEWVRGPLTEDLSYVHEDHRNATVFGFDYSAGFSGQAAMVICWWAAKILGVKTYWYDGFEEYPIKAPMTYIRKKLNPKTARERICYEADADGWRKMQGFLSRLDKMWRAR